MIFFGQDLDQLIFVFSFFSLPHMLFYSSQLFVTAFFFIEMFLLLVSVTFQAVIYPIIQLSGPFFYQLRAFKILYFVPLIVGQREMSASDVHVLYYVTICICTSVAKSRCRNVMGCIYIVHGTELYTVCQNIIDRFWSIISSQQSTMCQVLTCPSIQYMPLRSYQDIHFSPLHQTYCSNG